MDGDSRHERRRKRGVGGKVLGNVRPVHVQGARGDQVRSRLQRSGVAGVLEGAVQPRRQPAPVHPPRGVQVVAHAKGEVLVRGMDGGLPRRRRRGPILRKDGKSRGRRRARGRSRQPLDAKVGREVGRPGRMHQVDGYLGQPRPRRGRHGERPLQVLGREVGGEMGRQLQRERPRRSQAGSRLGRARRQPQGAHVG